jgi:hypothetical protein
MALTALAGPVSNILIAVVFLFLYGLLIIPLNADKVGIVVLAVIRMTAILSVYLAVWLIPGLPKDGLMVCSDVDHSVCELAQRNMDALDESKRVKVICEDAEKLLKSDNKPIDLFVLDAYGSKDNPDARYRGKAIYGPLIKAALPHLHDKSIILVHNAEKDAKDLVEFFKVMEHARFSLLLGTTDNMGVFQL